MSKEVHVLCDHDALYAAIDLKLSCLPQVHVIRLATNSSELPPEEDLRPDNGHPGGESSLIIVAPVPPFNDPMSILSKAALLNRVGQVPVLIISEQPSQPESDDKITYLNFPFDMDDLTETVAGILES